MSQFGSSALEGSPVKAMVVVAHPDDAEFGCSGSVAKFSRQGHSVVQVICSDGGKGTEDRSIPSKKLSEIRKKEQSDAARILGAKEVVFLDFPDGELEPNLSLRKSITRQIRRFRPEIVITTSPMRDLSNSEYIGHPDHFAAGEATLSAVFPSARDHLNFIDLLEDEKLDTWKVAEVWVMYGPNKPAVNAYYHELTKSDVDTAISALFAHKSQILDKDKERIETFMRERRIEAAKNSASEYAEPFTRFQLS